MHTASVSVLEAVMRDGTVLRADVYRPAGEGPWPVLLARTPYGRRDPGVLERLDPAAAAGRGHLVVIQDCRGRFGSAGEWAPLVHEPADGRDTIAWAGRLPGADGRVAMYGPSYLGHTQWAAAATNPPELCAVVPEFTWSDPHEGLISRGGAYEFGLMTQWTLSLGINVLERRYADRPEERRQRLAQLKAAIDGLNADTYWELPPGKSLRRFELPVPTSDERGCAWSDFPRIPTLVVAGWYDCFLQGSLDNYVRARSVGAPASLIVGPWTHDDQSAGLDDGDSLLTRELDWLDGQMLERHAPCQGNVRIFVMGVGEWRSLPDWPPEATGTAWYLHGDGTLQREAPESPPSGAAADVFVHDPADPVPTNGGALLLTAEFPAGATDQRMIEERDDVLTYTSPPLTERLEVIGRVTLHLFGGSTGPSPTADWVARLCDVDAEGVSRNITDGILRTDLPGQREHLIDLWSTAHAFLPGHRIRLHIAASCFPRWDRGPGAGLRTVHHDAARPSRLLLPVHRGATDLV